MNRIMLLIIKCIVITILISIFIFNNNVNVQNLNRLAFIEDKVKIITKQTYYKSNNNEFDVIIPNIEYEKEIDKVLNKEINKFTNNIIASFFKEYNKDNHHYLKIDYDVVTDNNLWFTLKVNVLEIMASSDNYFKYYHIDKKNNKIVNLNDLFKNNEYKIIFTKEILKQMNERMEKNKEIVYWINEDSISNGLDLIDNKQNFYFNKSGDIVIVFNEYEVGPGSIGTQEFTIDSKLYKKYLK